jgi:hypothetical protein
MKENKLQASVRKPRPIWDMELASGRLPTWCEEYAEWLSRQPSFQNMTNRAAYGRLRALRALGRTLRDMLPSAGWSDAQVLQIQDDIRDTAKIKASADLDE